MTKTGFSDKNGTEICVGDKVYFYNSIYYSVPIGQKIEGEIKTCEDNFMWKEKGNWHGITLSEDFCKELEIEIIQQPLFA